MIHQLDKIGRALATLRRAANLKNHGFTIISNTCVGGVIAHNVREPFRSPTVNLIIYEDQFLTFCRHLKEYATCPVEPLNPDEKEQFASLSYPIGVLRGVSLDLPDIYLLFVHYKTFEGAKEKWEARFRRVNYDDIFILMDRGMDARDGILDEFYRLPFEHKVFFTDKKDPARWPNNFSFSFYTPEKYVSGCLYRNTWRGMEAHHWMDEFDYVRWLNDGTIQNTNLKVVE